MGLLLLPWVLKFLWAPLVDRIGSGSPNHRKKWIVPLQILGALVLAIAAFLHLESQLLQVYILFLIYSFISATQDIATDGLAVLSLNRKQYGLGNIMQMGGYYLGELLGGAAILIIFDYFGWTASILFLALFFLLPLPFIIPYQESNKAPDPAHAKPGRKSISEFVWKNKAWLLVSILFMGNQVLARTMLPSLLSDRHYSESEIGFVIGVLGNGASILGAVLGGLIIDSLGRKRSLVLYGTLKIPAFFTLLLLPNLEVADGWILSGVLLNDLLAGLSTVALFTVMMDRSRHSSPGTDFTIQQSFNAIGILIFVILSGTLLSEIGLNGLVQSATIIGVLAVAGILLLRFPQDKTA